MDNHYIWVFYFDALFCIAHWLPWCATARPSFFTAISNTHLLFGRSFFLSTALAPLRSQHRHIHRKIIYLKIWMPDSLCLRFFYGQNPPPNYSVPPMSNRGCSLTIYRE